MINLKSVVMQHKVALATHKAFTDPEITSIFLNVIVYFLTALGFAFSAFVNKRKSAPGGR